VRDRRVRLFEYSSTVNFPDPHIAEWMCDQIPSDESPDGSNWQAVCDPELEALFKKELTQVDFAQRQQTFYQITRMIFEKVYWLGIWQDPDIWALGPRLQNVKLSGATPFFNIIEWTWLSSPRGSAGPPRRWSTAGAGDAPVPACQKRAERDVRNPKLVRG